MTATATRLILQADTAADLMSENPISLRADASVHEAIALMTDRGFAAAPVIDDTGRPIGVVSVTDILVHDREYARYLKSDATVTADLRDRSSLPDDMGIEIVDRTPISEIMTPAVFTIRPDAPASEVVRTMLARKVHHLFVADDSGVLVGVISMGDILRKLG
ncbi:MAG: CBS domain-containing protein [Gemmataceae bacterium]|nr:CBS domain-containing protein [Gemmataceae bacterium]